MAHIPDAQRLDGWKAIANFLGRERSTAIRWANERGLPVHRVPGGRTGTVYALAPELEAWLASGQRDLTDPPAGTNEATEAPTATAHPVAGTRLLAGLAVLVVLATAFVIWLGRGTPDSAAPVSVAAVASPGASRDTREFARGLNADLARFANASPDLAIFESEPGQSPQTQYAVRAEIESANGKMVAYARMTAIPRGQVIWSRRFEQSGPALSALREQVAANLIDVLRCSFGGLEAERSKVGPLELEQLMAICQSLEAGELAAGEVRAQQFTVRHPDLSLGWALLAMIQGAMVGEGKPVRDQALANSRIAAKIAPNGVNTWLARAAASVGGPTSPDALPIVDGALRAHPDEPWLLQSRSVILFNLGYVQGSVGDALSAVRNDPSSFGARDIAVRRLAAAGRNEEALRLQAENERLWADDPEVLANRARILVKRAPILVKGAANRETDLAQIASSERSFPDAPHEAYLLARLYERAGDHRTALAWLARAPDKDALQQWSLLFWPDAAGLRAEPAFFRKMAQLGLVRWWLARGKWPDFCSEPTLKYDCAQEASRLRPASRG